MAISKFTLLHKYSNKNEEIIWMNFYVVDHDQEEQKILKKAIERDFDNSILGITDNPDEAYQDAIRLSVDIIFINYELAPYNGHQLMRKIQQSHHHPHFILIGKALSPTIKSQIFKDDADYLLDEPLNVEELNKLMRLTIENIRMSRRLLQILDLVSGAANHHTESFGFKAKQEQRAKSILRFLGISGGVGVPDIIQIIKMMIEQECSFEELDLQKIYHFDSEGKKVLLQRIRRSLKKGLNNLAHICTSFSADDKIFEYANNLYGFESVENEIQFLKGKRKSGGRIEVEQFFNGLVQEVA